MTLTDFGHLLLDGGIKESGLVVGIRVLGSLKVWPLLDGGIDGLKGSECMAQINFTRWKNEKVGCRNPSTWL